MDLDTFVGMITILCLICLVLCEGTQQFLKFYENHYRLQWINRMIDHTILYNRLAHMYETDRLMELADDHVTALDDEWNKGIDAGST
jgi:hypothetical protein